MTDINYFNSIKYFNQCILYILELEVCTHIFLQDWLWRMLSQHVWCMTDTCRECPDTIFTHNTHQSQQSLTMLKLSYFDISLYRFATVYISGSVKFLFILTKFMRKYKLGLLWKSIICTHAGRRGKREVCTVKSTSMNTAHNHMTVH